jgi:hypothetical protein
MTCDEMGGSAWSADVCAGKIVMLKRLQVSARCPAREAMRVPNIFGDSAFGFPSARMPLTIPPHHPHLPPHTPPPHPPWQAVKSQMPVPLSR